MSDTPFNSGSPQVDDVVPLRPTQVEVNLSQLARNLDAIQAHVGRAQVMPILKANAYGHGLVPVARHLSPRVNHLGVAFLEEGLQLRAAGIRNPILVLGSPAREQIPSFLRHDLTLTVPSLEKLRWVEEAAAAAGCRARIHLKVDTGMGRIGVRPNTAPAVLEASLSCRHVQVEGIYSHFANADSDDLSHARLQIARFLEVLSFYEQRSLPMPLRHLANSGGILQLPDSHFDLVRPGILLYGVYPSPECQRSLPAQPALRWISRVSYSKILPPGYPVSYGSSWSSDHPVRLITVPVGYGDGYFRALSNKAQVLVHGRRHPVVGRVCMDQMLVNLESETAQNGDVVTLLGRDGQQTLTADELAAWAGTIPYEVLTNISARVPRVYRTDSDPA